MIELEEEPIPDCEHCENTGWDEYRWQVDVDDFRGGYCCQCERGANLKESQNDRP